MPWRKPPFQRAPKGVNDDIAPLQGGFFDGAVGEFLTWGLEDRNRSVGALVTPSHYHGPDLDGALRLIEAIEAVYDIDVDESGLNGGSATMRRQYQVHAERMQAIRDGGQSLQIRDFPEDRTYM